MLVCVVLAAMTVPVVHAAPVAIVIAYESAPVGEYSYLPGGDELPADTLFVDRGGSITFANGGRSEHHSMTSFAVKPDGTPRFDSGLTPPAGTAAVGGVSALNAGRYRFYCRKHQYQQGYLVVQ